MACVSCFTATRAYTEDLPSPASVLGFTPGDAGRLADWSCIEDYFARLDAASERVLVERVGRTTEGRSFLIVTISSPANMARLARLREINSRLADPRALTTNDEDELLRSGRLVIALIHGTHAGEVASPLLALDLAHRLASAQDEQTRAILDNAVLVMIPAFNPDGLQKIVEWHPRVRGTDYEGGPLPFLSHPYAGHDNNRDWYMFNLAETRLAVEHLYRCWHPQIAIDIHEMRRDGPRLFLPPYIEPAPTHFDPAVRAAGEALGLQVLMRLTAAGFTGVVHSALFDAWAPGRSYALTHNAARLLIESASARLTTPFIVARGDLKDGEGFRARESSGNHPLPWPGGVWRLADSLDYQRAAVLAALDQAAHTREAWLRLALAAGRRALATRDLAAIVIPAGQGDPLARVKFLDVMRLGGVEVERARTALVADGRTFPADSWILKTRQPSSAFLKTLLLPDFYRPARACPDGPPRWPYDVTAHALPLLMGIAAVPIQQDVTVATERVAAVAVEPGRIEGGGGSYALGHSVADFVAAARLLRAKVSVRWTAAPFVADGQIYPAGTLLAPASARDRLEALARELGVSARAVRAAPAAWRLRLPRVGLYRSNVPAIDEGWTRFVCEQQLEIPYRILRDTNIQAGMLKEQYDVVMLPDQAAEAIMGGASADALPPEIAGSLGRSGLLRLGEFARAGGTVLAFNRAAPVLARELGLAVEDVLADGARGARSIEPAFACPGSLLRVTVHADSPLIHGLPATLPVWFENGPAFRVRSGRVLMSYRDSQPLLSGWLAGGQRLYGNAAWVEVPLGRGRIILFGF
ncbi:MAG: hypothetical protein MUF51_07595, partial [Vicinamibacteria bacterium]|nr:hypothetical protein [Vicinamibacteria bacterium]